MAALEAKMPEDRFSEGDGPGPEVTSEDVVKITCDRAE
jgi:hypothetical protein